MRTTAQRIAWACGGALVASIIGWGLWFVLAWWSYGQASRRGVSDALVDQFMPRYEVVEQHAIDVAAPAAVTFEAARSTDLERSDVVHAVFALRRAFFAQMDSATPHLTLESLQAIGWGLLAAVPARELVFGAITKPWRGDVHFRALSPSTFAEFDSAGYAKIVWTLAVDSLAPGRSRFRTETRVLTTDDESRVRFRRYWALMSPGIVLIRWQVLRLVDADAERRARMPRDATAGRS